jgi:UDP-N-acetylglucosamine diphosphorylase/glucosamine-1-phosphate N-acetyltransferase
MECGETGDGILVSLMLMLIDKECDIETLLDYTPFPSVEGYILANNEEKERFKSSNIKNEIMDYAKRSGVRVVVRASGTEDKIRIIVEGESGEKIEQEYKTISEMVSKVTYQNMENKDNKNAYLGNQNEEIVKANYKELRERGVNILDDSLTVIEEGVEVGRDSVIYPFTHLKAGTRIGENVKIFPFTDLENTVVGSGAEVRSTYAVGAVIGEGATVGPFATLRKGAVIGKGCRVGNYVEIKNATLGEGVKVAHLAYVGDASVGARTNVGCGTVFANYNGKVKRRTEVGEGVFIGCNANLIAPLKIGDNAYIAGGTTIREDVEEDSFVITKSENEMGKRK